MAHDALLLEKEVAEKERVQSLTEDQRKAEELYQKEYALLCDGVTKRNKKYKIRRELESKYGFPAGSNGRFN